MLDGAAAGPRRISLSGALSPDCTILAISERSSKNNSRHARRAYWFGVANGVLFLTGLAFVDPATVLPTFVSRLTDSDIAVGLVSAIGMGGWFMPQLFAAHHMQGTPHKRPLYIRASFLRGTGWLIAIPLVLLFAVEHPLLALVGFFFGYSLFAFGGGLGGAAFLDIVAKTVPANQLGSFFGHRMFWGSLGAIAAGILVRTILAEGGISFPLSYALLFAIALVNFVVGWVIFAAIREPPGRLAESQSFIAMLKDAPKLIRRHGNYRLLLISRLLFGSSTIAFPFYIVYCRRFLAVPESSVGTYLTIEMVGTMIAIPLWAYLNDRHGARTLLLFATLLGLVAPGLAALASLLPVTPALGRLLLAGVFLTLAAVASGTFMGYTNYLIAIAPEERRPVYIGIQNTLYAVTAFLPVVGGVIIKLASFRVLFIVAAVFALSGALMAFRLTPLSQPNKD